MSVETLSYPTDTRHEAEIPEAERRESSSKILRELTSSFLKFVRKPRRSSSDEERTVDDFLASTGVSTDIETTEHLPSDATVIAEISETPEVAEATPTAKPEVVESGATFPETVQEIDKFSYLGGSSGVELGLWNGKMYAVKKARTSKEGDVESTNKAQLIEEYVADRIYEAFGFAVPNSKLYNDGEYKVASFIPGKDMNAFPGKTKEYKHILEGVQRGFALDALLANWDVIGTSAGDNIRLGEDGKVYRIDNGGALRFRARGAEKGKAFGSEVGELTSLRSLRVFSGLSEKEVINQIRDLVSKRDKVAATIDTAAEQLGKSPEDFAELKEILEKRLDYLEAITRRKKIKEQEAKKGEYESAITDKYFENWDEMKLEGNPEIFETIKQNIIKAEKDNEDKYEQIAKEQGLSVDELKQKLQDNIERIVANSYFFRATRADLVEKIMLEDGRWKSQFETNTSEGHLGHDFRDGAEQKMFGFDREKESNDKRPIYGYFSDHEHGVINHGGHEKDRNSVAFYGTVNFRIRRNNALRKATITLADSLDNRNDGMPPTPAAKPHFSSFYLSSMMYDKEYLNDNGEASNVNWGASYTEAQYHGQLTMDDIDSIHISINNGNSESRIEKIREVVKKYNELHPEKQIQLYEY